MAGHIHEMAAFTKNGSGGNPAGVWIGPQLPAPTEMQMLARKIGHSETAFVAGGPGPRRDVRYYSPEAEVSFCGHATVASGVVLGMTEGSGTYRFNTTVGDVPVRVHERESKWTASLESVEADHRPPDPDLLDRALALLDWDRRDVDQSIPPAVAYAGAHHLVLAAQTRARLADLRYEMDNMASLMRAYGLTTLQLVWCESDHVIHSRNPFAVGGVFEDPATGAAAAALGGYLRDASLRQAPFWLEIIQGEDMGRTSLVRVEVPETGGVIVFGEASPLDLDG